MIRLKHIILHLIPIMLLVVMAMAPAMAQNIVYTGQSSELAVVPVPGDTYVWELYNKDITGLNFATVPGNCPAGDALFTGGINTGPAVNVTWFTPGIYFFKVTASRAGCTNNLKVGKMTVLESLLTATISPPGPICLGDTVKLNITLTGTAPWSIDIFDGTANTTHNNVTSPFILDISPTTSTDYTVTKVTDANGTKYTASKSASVIVNPNPDFKFAYPDTICLEQFYRLDAGPGSADYTYKWSDGSVNPQLVATAAGLYSVVVTNNNGCKTSDSVMLIPCNALLWMPNAFTPNGDGLNDVFEAKYDHEAKFTFKMLVFNKWGEEIFKSNDIKKGWDGTYRGEPCPVDMYTWIISFEISGSNNAKQKSPIQGTVSLIK